MYPCCTHARCVVSGNQVRGGGRRGAPRLQDTIRLGADGLAMVLGDLEARIMRAAWDLGLPSSARQVHERVAERHDVQLLTVITVLNKLVDKGMLSRAKRHDVFHYGPRLTEGEFLSLASRRMVEGVLAFSPGAVAASLVDVLSERDPAQLADLSRLVQRRLRQQRDRSTEPRE